MRLETFRGRDMRAVAAEARRVFGDDALILHSRATVVDTRPMIEVVAGGARDLARLRDLVSPEPPIVRPDATRARRPYCVALVGPTGAGKTTTAAKLAVHQSAFGTRRAGFLSLDTHRAGAVEQLQAYADVAQLPCEVVHDQREVPSAMRRLSTCDVVIVDTPGRGPRATDDDGAWRAIVDAIRPDEVHLVVSATTRLDLIGALRRNTGHGVATHALLTKLDEVPGDTFVAELAGRLDLPIRWVTDGQDVPADLHAADTAILSRIAAPMAASA